MAVDLVIHGGTIVTPERAFKANVAIEQSKIVCIGSQCTMGYKIFVGETVGNLPNPDDWELRAEGLHSKNKFTSFGCGVKGLPVHTIVNGHPVMSHGQIIEDEDKDVLAVPKW